MTKRARRPVPPQLAEKPDSTLSGQRLKPVAGDDPNTMPDRYIVITDGDCLEPLVTNGARIIIERDAKIASGDLVLLYFKPEHVPGGK